MSSDFEKSLARAAAERSALDAAKTQQQHEQAEKIALARSIIDPYLAELGPQVVKVLRELGVPTKRRYDRYGPDGGVDLGYWEFECARDSDNSHFILMNTSGEFLSESYKVGLVKEGRLEAPTDDRLSTAFLVADLEDQRVRVSRKPLHSSHSFDPSKLQELGEFLAGYIYGRMKV